MMDEPRVPLHENSTALLLMTALVVILFVAIWVGSLITDNLAVQSAIALSLAVTLIAASVASRRAGTKKGRVVSVLFAWLAMTVTFAVIYAGVYRSSPTSFRATRDIYDEAVMKRIDGITPELKDAMQDLYCVRLLDAAAPELAAALAKPGRRKTIALTPDVSFDFSEEIHQRVGSDPMQPSFTATVTMIWRDRSSPEPLNIIVHTLSGLEADPRKRFAEAMERARTTRDVHDTTAIYSSFLVHRIQRLDRESRKLLATGVSLDISHFLFMSGAISTTIGSADVTANSTSTRYLLLLQGFCSVFLFGYAAEILWT